MNRYRLLILLSSWSLLVTHSYQCETGVAHPFHVLSMQRSLMANADVAFLTVYNASSVDQCLNDCCSGKFGSCTVVSFKKTAKKDNCLLFNCQPLIKCKFLSSNTTDSFSFSASPFIRLQVPSKNTSSKVSSPSTLPSNAKLTTEFIEEHGVTKEEIATFSHEHFDLKNDNTTIKPRKGVTLYTFNDDLRSGIKPPKGTSMEDVTRSKVKPRKGVPPYNVYSSTIDSEASSTFSIVATPNDSYSSVAAVHSPVVKHRYDSSSLDFMSALEKVFEDDPEFDKLQSAAFSSVMQTSSSPVATPTTRLATPYTAFLSEPITASSTLKSSFQTTVEVFSTHFSSTPCLESSTQTDTSKVIESSVVPIVPTLSIVSTPRSQMKNVAKEPSNFAAANTTKVKPAKILNGQKGINEESENERKYKTSMHLVLSLVFGLVVLFAVLGVVAKRMYDGWMRRHYRRMDFLIDGLYNGYE